MIKKKLEPANRKKDPAKETTIFDVAHLAGVAISTVSLALRRDPRVAPDTSKVILAAAKTLNYHPNISAQNLAQRQTNLIAVFGWFNPDSLFSNSLASIQMLMGIQERLKSTEYAIYLVNWFTQQHEQIRVLKDASNRRFLGGAIWLTPTLIPGDIRQIRESSLPVVCTEVSCPGVDNITLDNVLGGYLGTRHLLDSGRHSLALVTGHAVGQAQKDRLKGCQNATKESKLPWSPILKYEAEAYSFDNGLRAAKEISRSIQKGHPVDAVFCLAGDRTALGLIKGLKQAGFKIPQDIAVLGFDNLIEASYSEPSLSTIEQPLSEMGRQAANLLLKRIESPESQFQKLKLQPVLILRESA